MIARVKKETEIRASIENLQKGIIGKIFKDTRIIFDRKVRGKNLEEDGLSSNQWFQDRNGWYYWGGALVEEELNVEWDYKKKLVNAPGKWVGNHGEKIKIMVIDGGFNLLHPGLKHLNLSGHKFDVTLDDWAEQTGNTDVLNSAENGSEESNSHGNAVLSIISAIPDLTFLIKGISTKAEIFVVKAQDKNNLKSQRYYIRALEIAAKLDVDIVTCSMGLGDPKPAFHDRFNKAVKKLNDKKTLILQALPNSNKYLLEEAKIKFPTNHPDIMKVGMIKKEFYQSEILSEGAKFGKQVDLLMPKTNLKLFNQDDIRITKGSSFATPYFAGLVALYLRSIGGRQNIELSEVDSGLLRSYFLRIMGSERVFTSFNSSEQNPYFFLPK